MATRKKAEQPEISLVQITTEQAVFRLVGRTPMITNSMSNKAKQTLLAPPGRKTSAEKKGSIKHDVIAEFRESPYLSEDPNSPTYIQQLSTCFKAAIRDAALDIPGATKAQLGRLLWVEGERVAVYGIPKLFMSITRSADRDRTPDVRTRCILPEWAAEIEVRFVRPILNVTTVSNLLSAAGLTQGVGDWRPQKGSGNYGQFEIVPHDDEVFGNIAKMGGYKAQKQAMEDAIPYDSDTERLLRWFHQEAKTRGMEITKGGKVA